MAMRNENADRICFLGGELNVVSLPRGCSQAQVWSGGRFNLIESG